MSIRKFRYCGLSSCAAGDSVTLERDEENHLFKTLRARPGEEVGLLDGRGRVADALVCEGKTLAIRSVRVFDPPARRIHLYLAPPRRQKMDDILRASAELGVFRIVPLKTEYGVSEPDSSSVSGRWNDLLFEACKQSGNPFLPACSPLMDFRTGLEDAKAHSVKLFYGSPVENAASSDRTGSDLAWFVGPEGGFSPEEEALLAEAHAIPLRIGNWILRVETAALAGIAVLQSRLS